MSSTVFVLVLFAALLHALWNGLLKIDGERFSAMTVIVAVQGLMGGLMAGFVRFPDSHALLFLVPAALLHAGYRLFLLEAYRFGDLSRVYPIARGSAPVVVTMLAAVLAGEYPSAQGFAAIGLIAVGIMSLALNQGLDPVRDSRAALLALATGCIAAVYTVVDGLGARYIGSLSYMMWASLLDAVFFLPVVFFAKRGRLLPIRASTCLSGIVAGVIGFVAYWLIVWALSVAPMGPVSALRAAGIGFAVIFGAVVLKEPMTALKSAAIAAIAAGTAMLKLGK